MARHKPEDTVVELVVEPEVLTADTVKSSIIFEPTAHFPVVDSASWEDSDENADPVDGQPTESHNRLCLLDSDDDQIALYFVRHKRQQQFADVITQVIGKMDLTIQEVTLVLMRMAYEHTALWATAEKIDLESLTDMAHSITLHDMVEDRELNDVLGSN